MTIVISGGVYNSSITAVDGKDMASSGVRDGALGDVLVSSPYAGLEHHLDLTTVDESSRQLALALRSLKPVTIEYPIKPYSESFNWQEIVDQLPPSFAGNPQPGRLFKQRLILVVGEFYCIAFYSTLHPNVDTDRLHNLDGLAHAEANSSGGLLKYWWQGPPDPSTRRNLATCVWTSWEQAKRAGRLPRHGKAMAATRDSYEKWGVERYYLKIEEGNQWKLERIVA
jgi:hypothetical protein